MSRHGVIYKPGGAIAKPLEITLKMQRVKTVAPAVPDAPVIACPVMPNLTAIWSGPDGSPLYSEPGIPASNVDVAIQRVSTWCDSTASCLTDNSGAFLQMARMVNADVQAAGIAAPLVIDQSKCSWVATWNGGGGSPLISIAGSALSVAYSDGVGLGELIIDAEFDGTVVSTLTLNITGNVSGGCA
ncbi:MAG: hypothetical protein WC073_10800 [Sterolibacterium sp.]